MHRLTPGIAILTLIYVSVYAPLFHVHDYDDHGKPEHVVHAHFAGPGNSVHLEGIEVEANDSHHETRWIEFFTLAAPVVVTCVVVDVSQALALPLPETQESVAFMEAPRAHSPPRIGPTAPRSPPTS